MSLKNLIPYFWVPFKWKHYIPIYHAINIPTFIYSLFTHALHSIEDSVPCNVPMIRFPSADQPRTITEHFQKFPVNPDDGFYDWKPEVALLLLACNPYLFSNLDSPKECTWKFYLNGSNIAPPDKVKFFTMFCEKYKLPHGQRYENRFLKLYERLHSLQKKFFQHHNFQNRGMLLQILIPSALIDKIAYASQALGIPYSNSKLPLSKKCKELRKNPRREREMQVRFLIQSLFEDNGIKVFTHGCSLFLPEETTDNSIQSFYVEKNKIICDIKKLFTDMILFGKSQQAEKCKNGLNQTKSLLQQNEIFTSAFSFSAFPSTDIENEIPISENQRQFIPQDMSRPRNLLSSTSASQKTKKRKKTNFEIVGNGHRRFAFTDTIL